MDIKHIENAILIWGPLNESAIAYLKEQRRKVIVPEMRPSCMGLSRVLPVLKKEKIPAIYCTDNMLGLLFMKKKIGETIISYRKEDKKGITGISGSRYVVLLSRLHGVKIKLFKGDETDYNTVFKDTDASTILGKTLFGQLGSTEIIPAAEEQILWDEMPDMKNAKVEKQPLIQNVLKAPKERKDIIFWSGLLHQKDLLSAGSGNVSCRSEDGQHLYMTAHHSYLGFLEEGDVIKTDMSGTVVEGMREVTSEKLLHTSIYKAFPETRVVLHAHSPFTVAYFNEHEDIEYISFECKFYLGKIPVVPQDTPTVTDAQPVLEALSQNKIIVLRNHGVVAMAKEFKEAYSLIELLEQQCYVKILTAKVPVPASVVAASATSAPEKPVAYELFSEEHMKRVTDLVNHDKQNLELGKKYNLTTTLAVKNITSGLIWCFHYQQGRITKCDHHEAAEFIITAPEDIWKKIFNRQIDPFVASTQGIIKLKGDFNKMSAWFPVFERTFKLWEQAPVL